MQNIERDAANDSNVCTNDDLFFKNITSKMKKEIR